MKLSKNLACTSIDENSCLQNLGVWYKNDQSCLKLFSNKLTDFDSAMSMCKRWTSNGQEFSHLAHVYDEKKFAFVVNYIRCKKYSIKYIKMEKILVFQLRTSENPKIYGLVVPRCQSIKIGAGFLTPDFRVTT